MPLTNIPAQGNNQGEGGDDVLTERETMLAEALMNVLVAAGMLRRNATVSPAELLMAAEGYIESQNRDA